MVGTYQLLLQISIESAVKMQISGLLKRCGGDQTEDEALQTPNRCTELKQQHRNQNESTVFFLIFLSEFSVSVCLCYEYFQIMFQIHIYIYEESKMYSQDTG